MSGLRLFFSTTKQEAKAISYDDSLAVAPGVNPPGPPSGHPVAWTTNQGGYLGWKEFHLEWIRLFLHHRCSSIPKQKRREQQRQQLNKIGNSDIQQQHPDESWNVVPHVNETLHICRHMGDLNLMTKCVNWKNGNGCRVTKFYRLRNTQRSQVVTQQQQQQKQKQKQPRSPMQYTNHDNQLVPMSCLTTPTPPSYYCEYDGPLAALYPHVAHMELTHKQQHQQQSSTTPTTDTAKVTAGDQLRKLATAVAMSELDAPPQTKRISIYWYGKYAHAIQSIWDQAVSTTKTTLTTTNWEMQVHLWGVSAIHVFPNAATGSNDWFNRHDMAPYCLCFFGDDNGDGDDSSNYFGSEQQQQQLDEELNIRILLLSNQQSQAQQSVAVLKEWELSKHYPNYKREISRNLSLPKKNPPKTTQIVSQQTTTTTATTTRRQRLQTAETTVDHSYVPLAELAAQLASFQSYTPDPRTNPCLVNVFAVVIGMTAPCQTTTRDWMISWTLTDESCCCSCLQKKEEEEKEPTTTTTNSSNPQQQQRRRRGHPPWMIRMNVFGRTQEDIPVVHSCGDVVRIHRARIQTYQTDIQLVGSRKPSYVVFRRKQKQKQKLNNNNNNNNKRREEEEDGGRGGNKDDDDWEMTSPNHNVTISKANEIRMKKLWEWGQTRIRDYPTMGLEYQWTLASHAKHNNNKDHNNDNQEEGDITAMITAVIPIPKNTNHDNNHNHHNMILPQGFLRIWDGTGVTSDPYPISSNQVFMPEGDPPPEAIGRLCQVVTRLRQQQPQQPQQPQHCCGWRDLSLPEAVIGRVANVAIWEESQWTFLQNEEVGLGPGSFLRLRNVREGTISIPNFDNNNNNSNTVIRNHQRYFMAFTKTHLTPLPDMTYEVIRLIEEHDKRLKRKEPINPHSGVLPLDTSIIMTTQPVTTPDRMDPEEQEAASDLPPPHHPMGVVVTTNDPSSCLFTTSSFLELVVANSGPAVFSGDMIRIVDTIPPLISEQNLLDFFRSQGCIGLKLCQKQQEAGGGGGITLTVLVENIKNQDSSSSSSSSSTATAAASSQVEALLLPNANNNNNNNNNRVVVVPATHAGTKEQPPPPPSYVSQLRQAIRDKRYAWKADIICTIYQGSKFFVLDSLCRSSS